MFPSTAVGGLASFIHGGQSSCSIKNCRNVSRLHSPVVTKMSDGIGDNESVHQHPSNPETRLLQLAQSHFVAQTLLAFVRLGIQDILSSNSNCMTVDEIVAQIKDTSIRHDVLFRCLRLLCTAGVVRETGKTVDGFTQSAFSLTDAGMLLQTTHPQSMTPFILHWMEEPLWIAWSHLPDYLIEKDDDTPPFDTANHMSASEYYANNKISQLHRNAVARYASSREISSVLEVIISNVSPHLNEMSLATKTIVDIGGGYGDLLIEVKKRIPSLGKCYCLDLKDVIEDAHSTEKEGADTITLIPGDMFDYDSIPKCDIIFTKHVLCDFSDKDVVRALKSFQRVLDQSGKLVIMDAALPNGEDLNGKWNAAVSFDVLLMLSGRRGERSQLEWSNLALKAGFILDEVLTTSSVTLDLVIFSKDDT